MLVPIPIQVQAKKNNRTKTKTLIIDFDDKIHLISQHLAFLTPPVRSSLRNVSLVFDSSLFTSF